MRKILPIFLIFVFCFLFSVSTVSAACSGSGENYGSLQVLPPVADRPANQHPDLNLSIRGYVSASKDQVLVEIPGPTETIAPQLNTLFEGGGARPIVGTYQVYDWNWANNAKGQVLDEPEVTLLGFGASSGEALRLPRSGYTIGSGYEALVLYATDTSITLKYTNNDTVATGYTLQLEDICVDQNLLNLYQNLNSQGRKSLPALRSGQIFGFAASGEVKLAIRDSGCYMDPRSRKDWWQSLPQASKQYIPQKDSCAATAGGVINPKPFTPTRKVETNDTTSSLTDPVKFKQEASLFPGETKRTVTRAGFFDLFKDLSVPFAQELTQYLAGPFAYQGNAVIQNTLGLGRPEKAGVLARLTSSDLQTEMRKDYLQKCQNGTYCSSQNIGSSECPNASSNECLIADGTDIGAIQAPPQAGDPSYNAWQRQWGKKWVQIPLVANPKTFVNGAVKMAACDGGGGTTVTTRTPWVSALKDTSVFLSGMLLSSGQNKTAQSPKTNNLAESNTGKVLQAQTACPQIGVTIEKTWVQNGRLQYGVRVTHNISTSLIHVQINNHLGIHYENIPSGSGGIYLQTDYPMANLFLPTYPVGTDPSTIPLKLTFEPRDNYPSTCPGDIWFQGSNPLPPGQAPACAPPALPASKPGGGSDEVDITGHALLVGPTTTLTCEEWTGNKCTKGSAGDDFATPVWPVVYYPYLSTIHEALAGQNGIFQAIFKPAKSETNNWSDAGESDLNYCLASVPDYMANKAPGYWLRGGGLYPYQVPFTPSATCAKDEFTQNLKVYPEKIGGVKNAQEWVIKELNP